MLNLSRTKPHSVFFPALGPTMTIDVKILLVFNVHMFKAVDTLPDEIRLHGHWMMRLND